MNTVKSQTKKRPYVRHKAISLLAVLWSVAPAVALAGAGIDPWVLSQLESRATTEFIVRFNERAQFDDVRESRDVLQRRTTIVDRLRETASLSQADLVNRLYELGVNHRSFWITNAN